MRVVGAAIKKPDGKIFIARRGPWKKNLPLEWEFPGGKVEGEETDQEALARELKQELDIEAEIGEFIAESTCNEINLFVYEVIKYSGAIRLVADHDLFVWSEAERLTSFKLAEADIPIARKLAST